MLEALRLSAGEENDDFLEAVKGRTTGWRQRFVTEILITTSIVGVAAVTNARELNGPLSPVGFHSFVGTLFALSLVYLLASRISFRHGMGPVAETLLESGFRFAISITAIIVDSSIINPQAWSGEAPWYSSILWGFAGIGLTIAVVNHWQLEVRQLRLSRNTRTQGGATNFGLALLVSAGAASALSTLAFLNSQLLPTSELITSLWMIAASSLLGIVALQLSADFELLGGWLRLAGVGANVGLVMVGISFLFLRWPHDSTWSKLPGGTILLLLSLVALTQALEEHRFARRALGGLSDDPEAA